VGISLVLDIIVAVLLVVTIAYAVILNRRLDVLRRNKAELQDLAATFGDATARAGDNIRQLKDAAEELRGTMNKATALRDDLVFLVERGGTSADRLEEAVREARGLDDGRPSPAAAEPNGTSTPSVTERPTRAPRQEPAPTNIATRAAAKSKAEQELLRALQAAR
jgi:methyl-accepting chemotaxis protein